MFTFLLIVFHYTVNMSYPEIKFIEYDNLYISLSIYIYIYIYIYINSINEENSANKLFGDSELSVQHNGAVIWAMPLMLKTSCKVRYFNFNFIFINWLFYILIIYIPTLKCVTIVKYLESSIYIHAYNISYISIS